MTTMLRRLLAFAVALTMAASVLTIAPAAAQQELRPALSRRSVSEAPDFASIALADSWDFGQPRDLVDEPGLTHKGFTNVETTGGQWKGQAEPAANVRLLQSWNSLPNGRDGETTPIDADTYTHVSIRMRLTGHNAAWGELSWYDCGRLAQECRGAQGVRVFEGWHTYDFEIQNDPSRGPIDWAGEIRGIVFTPSAPGGSIELDWVRLYQPSNGPITVTSRDASPDATLIWDRDRDASNNTAQNPNWGVISEESTGEFNVDAMFPGAYHVYSLRPDGSRSLINTLKVNKRPRPRVLQPDAIGGTDYATVVRGDAWDFSEASDQSLVRNMTFTIDNGELIGRNTAPTASDSGFRVTIPADKRIDGSRFTNFSARVFYEGDFSLSGDPGGGMNARLIWRTTDGLVRVSEDIVVFPGWNTITIDLDDTPPASLIEGGATSAAWDGKQIELLRFDPHEDIGTREFWVDWIKLSENDKPVNNKVVIGFRDLAHQQGSKVRIFLDRDGDGNGDKQIALRSVWFGHNIHRWPVTSEFRGTGEWFITIKITDPEGVTTTATSTGTVEL